MVTKTKKATKARNRVSTNGQIEVEESQLQVKTPNFQNAVFHIYGTAPYVQNKFSGTKTKIMLETQQQTKGTSRKAKAPRDVEAEFEGAKHRMEDGSYGIPAPAFRSALISACRVAGLVMTKCKLSIFCHADGFDEDDGTPLVRLIAGEPEKSQLPVRLESGVASIAIRPMWRRWEADVHLRWDADQFSQRDVMNLLERAGQQVGIGEGRNDSKKSNGMGWGSFSLMVPE